MTETMTPLAVALAFLLDGALELGAALRDLVLDLFAALTLPWWNPFTNGGGR